MDHYFLLLEEETKNRHSQQLKVLRSQASACNVGIINTKQKSCPRCRLSANSLQSLGVPPAGAPGGTQPALVERSCRCRWRRWNFAPRTLQLPPALPRLASPDPALRRGCTFLSITHKPRGKSSTPCDPRDLPLPRAWGWSGFYRDGHVKIKRRGQEEESRALSHSTQQSSPVWFWPLAVHSSQLLGWMDLFSFLFRIILRSSIRKIQSNRSMLVRFSPEKIFKVIRKQKEYIWPDI